LANLGIHSIGDITARPEIELVQLFGKHGYDLSRRAQGIDDRPVETQSETKSVSRETTFERDVKDRELLRQTLLELSEDTGQQLRRERLKGSTIKIKLRWANFTTLTRQTTLAMMTDQGIDIYQAALGLFENTWDGDTRVRLLGVGVSNFEPQTRQLGLWDSALESPEPESLAATLGKLRERFGEQAVRRGNKAKP